MGWAALPVVLRAFFLLLLASTRLAARVPKPKLAKPDYSIYKTLDGVFKSFQETVARCPTFMKITEFTEGDANYSLTMPMVTVEPGGLTEDRSGKIRVLLDFGEHGRELISSEIGLRLLGALCDGGDALAALAGRAGVGLEELQEVLNRTVLQVIPMENVHGRERVESGELCERKNGRGVDPNRNWAVDWGTKEPDYDPKEEYPGTAPFSEPEALIVRKVAQDLQPHVWVNVHSGMEALFMPYDHKNTIPDGASANATLELLKQLDSRICGGRCAVGSGGKSVGYLAHGTATDYMYEELHVPLAFTWEVYGDFNASYLDCFRMFNPLGKEEFEATVDNWAAAVLALLALLPEHPDIPPPPPAATGGGRAVVSQPGAGGAGGEAAGSRREHAGVVLELDDDDDGLRKGGAQQQQQGGAEGQQQQSKEKKAAAIAAALQGNPIAQTAEEGSEAGSAAATGGGGGSAAASGGSGGEQQRQRTGGGGGGGVPGRDRWHHRALLPGSKADWEAVAWFFVAVLAIVVGYLLYSRPRVRYALSRWGLLSRRSDIPL